MSTNEPRDSASGRAAAAFLLGAVGLLALAIGVALLFGGAWTAVVVGAVLLAYSMILALPDKTMWG